MILTFFFSFPWSRRRITGRNHGDERAVRGDRQGLRPAILRALRRPGAETEPHKHVQHGDVLHDVRGPADTGRHQNYGEIN